MNAERWERIKTILAKLDDLPKEQRGERLVELAGDDPLLVDEIQGLLDSDKPDGVLDHPPFPRPAESATGSLEGKQLGAYRVHERLERGGMGEVYLGSRVDDFKRRVAIKVILEGTYSRSAIRRFENERQILAGLEHSNIARLLDGGQVDQAPYLVMELVKGRRIDRYCEEENLEVADRIELFLQLCEAVTLLHQNLIVHRDLKPSNVLVTPEGQVKLIDFGIAKTLRPQSRLHDNVTELGLRPLTVAYASPEQIRHERTAPASDIYSLGVLLFRLLTGQSPYRDGLEHHHEMAAAICDDSPRWPSVAAGSRRLRGDLDSIVLKALCKKPSQRYASVEQFSKDLRHHSTGLPVSTRRGDWRYLFAKRIRHHRVAITFGFLFVITTVSAYNASTQRDKAELAQEGAVEFATALETVLKEAKPGPETGSNPSALQMLKRGREQLLQETKEPSALRGDLFSSMAKVYRDLGLYPSAQLLYARAVTIWRQLGGPSERLAKDLNNLASVFYIQGELGPVILLLQESFDIYQTLDTPPETLARLLSNIGSFANRQGDFEFAQAKYHEALDLRRHHFGERSPEVSKSLYNLGLLAFNQSRFEEAEALLRDALEIQISATGKATLATTKVMSTLGRVLVASDQLEEAEPLIRQVLSLRQGSLARDHPRVALAIGDSAELLLAKGHAATAYKLAIEALETHRLQTPNEDFQIARARNLVAACLVALQRYSEAEPLMRQSTRVIVRERGETSYYTLRAQRRLADLDRRLFLPPTQNVAQANP